MFHLHSSPPPPHLSCISDPHPGTIPNPSRFQYVSLTSILVLINEIQATRFLSRLHPWTVSIKVHRFASLLHRGCISIQSRPPYSHFTSMQAPILKSQLHPGRPGPDICISFPSRWRLTSIHVRKNAAQLHPGPELGVSPQSRSHVTSIQVTRIAPQLHPSPIPTFPRIKICSLTQFRSHRTPIHFLRFTSHLNLGS